MTNVKIEISAEEKMLIIMGLKMLSKDAEKVYASTTQMNIVKAAGEVKTFKDKITQLSDKVEGKVKLL